MPRTRQGPDLQIRTMAVVYSPEYRIPRHSHDWHQLVYATRGVMSVHTAGATWVVPPHRAVWILADVEHEIETTGPVSMRTLYIRPDVSATLPGECCVVNISPLLRELILHAVERGALDGAEPAHARLIGVLLDQLEALPVAPLALPMPTDERARRVADLLQKRPGEPASLEEISVAVGSSKRTLERLFLAETRMTFGKWRQQLRLLHGLRRLAAGEAVTNVALEVGYDSPSAFIAMFKKALGTTPSRYHAAGRER